VVVKVQQEPSSFSAEKERFEIANLCGVAKRKESQGRCPEGSTESVVAGVEVRQEVKLKVGKILVNVLGKEFFVVDLPSGVKS